MSNDSTTALFGLTGIAVLRVDREPDGGRVVHARTDDVGEAALVVRWHKRQWSCREAACPRRAFTEQIPEILARARLTGRLRRHVAARVDDGLTVSAACQGPGASLMSWPIGHAAFVVLADIVLAEVDKQTGIAAAEAAWEDGSGSGVVRVVNGQ